MLIEIKFKYGVKHRQQALIVEWALSTISSQHHKEHSDFDSSVWKHQRFDCDWRIKTSWHQSLAIQSQFGWVLSHYRGWPIDQ